MKSLLVLLSAIVATTLPACGVSPDESTDAADQAIAATPAVAVDEDAASPTAYFIVTHPDWRKCPYPMCGGWFVKAVNLKETVCADGSLAPECHATTLDLKAVGLAPEVAIKFQEVFGQSHALVRGKLRKVLDGYGHLVDTLVGVEAWRGAAGSTATGQFYGVTDSPILCLTYPCPQYTERLLNTGLSQYIYDVDLAASGASKEAVAAGFVELHATGILVAGVNVSKSASGGLVKLVASEFYDRVLPDEPCGDEICKDGTYCCNPLLSICAPKGQPCIQ